MCRFLEDRALPFPGSSLEHSLFLSCVCVFVTCFSLTELKAKVQQVRASSCRLGFSAACGRDDDDTFTPTKHSNPLPTTATGPQRLTPTRRHPCCTKKKGRARRRTAATDLAHSWPTPRLGSLFVAHACLFSGTCFFLFWPQLGTFHELMA